MKMKVKVRFMKISSTCTWGVRDMQNLVHRKPLGAQNIHQQTGAKSLCNSSMMKTE